MGTIEPFQLILSVTLTNDQLFGSGICIVCNKLFNIAHDRYKNYIIICY